MTFYLSLALAALQFINWVAGKVDAAERRRLVEAAVNADNLKADMKAVADANAARDAVVVDLRDHPGRVRVVDDDARRPGP